MSREIRRVPSNWEHPRDAGGRYKPLYDNDYDSQALEWLQGLMDWEAGKNETRSKHNTRYWWDWEGPPPDQHYYRPKWTEEPTHYQIYEDVSEGTPVSPIFASLAEMKAWLLSKGYSEHAASMFVEDGWAPSLVFTPERGISGIGIHSLDFVPAKEQNT